MPPADPEPLPFPAFQAHLAEFLNLDPALLQPEAHFVADLGVDSLRLVTALFHLQEMGIELPPELAWEAQTVGEAYRLYREVAVAQRPG